MNDFEFRLKESGLVFHKDASVKKYVTINIGGIVPYIIITRTVNELESVLHICHSTGTKYVVLGGGSNTIFSDEKLDFALIVNRCKEIDLLENNILRVNSGVTNISFLSYCIENCIEGFEFLSGIPGSIGGAVAVNAGAFGKSISDFVHSGEIFENGKKTSIGLEFFNFEYRNSILKHGTETLLNIYFSCKKGDSKKIKKKIEDVYKIRTSKHPPYSSRSAGCFFKNPVIRGEKIPAGKLIEDVSLKGFRKGDLTISDYHSNFIINRGNSSFNNIRQIEKMIIQKVRNECGITLNREVIFVSPEGKKY